MSNDEPDAKKVEFCFASRRQRSDAARDIRRSFSIPQTFTLQHSHCGVGSGPG
jgi:hypothetical protein